MKILFWSWPRLDGSTTGAPVGRNNSCFLGTETRNFDDFEKTIDTNTGNYIHLDAPSRFLKYDTKKSHYFQAIRGMSEADWNAMFDYINGNFDAVVISYANSLRPDADKGGHHKLINGLNIDVYMFGLGLQEWFEPGLDNVSIPTRNFLTAANEKAKLWCVRGDRTRQWLVESGIENAITTGCPSMYSFPNGVIEASSKYKDILKICENGHSRNIKFMTAGHLQRGRIGNSEKRWRSDAIFDLFEGYNADYVFQGEPKAYYQLRGTKNFYNDISCEINRDTLLNYFGDKFQIRTHFNRYLMFLDPNVWRYAASKYDFYIGDRLHCGVACLQAGTPAILLYDDERVKEIAEYFMIPCYPMSEVSNSSIEYIIAESLANFDEKLFMANYMNKLAGFVILCERSGLIIHDSIKETLRDAMR